MTLLNFSSVQIEEIRSDDKIFWKVLIHNAYPDQGHWWVTLRERIIHEAQKAGVSKFIFEVNGREEWYPVPTERQLKQMRKMGLVEEKVINFPQSPMRSYLFKVK